MSRHGSIPAGEPSSTPATPQATTTATPAAAPPALLLPLLCLAEFMLVLDVTAVNVALPSIGRDLGMSSTALPWVITAYVVTFGGLMLLGGRLTDAYGRRGVLATGLLVFTTASLVCGLAESPGQLVAGRVAQGAGAALMSPAALSCISALYEGPRRLRALGAWAGVGSAGFAAGLMVSGALTAGPGWAWIFLVNVPIGVVLLPALVALVPRRHARRQVGVDALGGLLATAAVASLVYGVTALGEGGARTAGAAVGVAVLAGGAFVLRGRAVADPLVPPRLLAQRALLVGLALMLAASGAMLSTFYVASLHLQTAEGASPLTTGFVFLPAAVGVLVAAHAAGPLISAHGTRSVAMAAFAVTAAGAAVLAAGAGSVSMVGAGLAVTSLGLGPAFVVATSTTLATVGPGDSGAASGIVNTGHELGGAFGVAGMAALIGGDAAERQVLTAFLLLAVCTAVLALLSRYLVADVRPAPGSAAHGHAH